MIDRFNRSQLTGKQTYWLVTIQYAGKSIRLSTAELDIESDDGDIHYFDGIDDIAMRDSLELFNDSLSENSLSLEAMFPVDVAALTSVGHDLSSSEVEVSEWIEGTTYEARRVAMVGSISDPEYGDTNTSVRFTIVSDATADTTEVPEQSAKVSTATANPAVLADGDLELPYPLIFGHPGQIDEDSYVTGSQMVWMDKTTAHHEGVIAGGWVTARYVYLNNDDFTTPTLFAIASRVDLLGRPVSMITSQAGATPGSTPETGTAYEFGLDAAGVDASFQPAISDSVKVCVSWRDPDDLNRGGMAGDDGETMRGAGDILMYLLRQSKKGADVGKIKAIASRLNAFKLDFVIDEFTGPLEFISANLLPILPVSLVSGPAGWYLVFWNYMATSADVLSTIDEDRNPAIDFGERISYDNGKIANQFVIKYAISIRTGNYQRSVTLGSRQPSEYASADMVCQLGDRIRIYAKSSDAAGDGIAVTVTGPAPLAVAESATEKTVSIVLPASGSASTTNDIIGIINTLTTVRAVLTGGNGLAPISGSTALGADATGMRQSFSLSLAKAKSIQASLACGISQRRQRSASNKTGIITKRFSSLCIYDPATAGMVAAWWARAFCFATRTVEARVPADEFGWLVKGNEVALTSSRLGLSSQVALIEEIESAGTGVLAMRFRIVADPARDVR